MDYGRARAVTTTGPHQHVRSKRQGGTSTCAANKRAGGALCSFHAGRLLRSEARSRVGGVRSVEATLSRLPQASHPDLLRYRSVDRPSPPFAEFIIGPRFARTRWLMGGGKRKDVHLRGGHMRRRARQLKNRVGEGVKGSEGATYSAHSREGGNPVSQAKSVLWPWVPAFAGTSGKKPKPCPGRTANAACAPRARYKRHRSAPRT